MGKNEARQFLNELSIELRGGSQLAVVFEAIGQVESSHRVLRSMG